MSNFKIYIFGLVAGVARSVHSIFGSYVRGYLLRQKYTHMCECSVYAYVVAVSMNELCSVCCSFLLRNSFRFCSFPV